MTVRRSAGPAGRPHADSDCLHTFRMGSGYRGDQGGEDTEQPDAYWRRRVITLALGLGLLGILAWGFSGGGGKTTQSSPGSALQATALGTAIPGLASSAPAVSPSASSPSASGGTSSPSPSPSASALGTATPLASTRPAPSANPAAPRAADGGRCGPGSVVLSLFTDRASYGPGQLPLFQVYAVSTTAASCWFNPAQLQVQVMASGRIVWDSADCVRNAGRTVELTRGVPAQASVTWNRSITLPGCQVLASSARPGGYTVQARTATVQSPVRTFHLAG